MKKVISAVLAGAMCVGTFSACSNRKDDKKSSGLSTKGNSEYVSITPLDGKKQPFSESIDEGIEYSMDLAKEYEKDNDSKYNPHLFKFSGDEFLFPIWDSSGYLDYYDGTFSVKNRKIKFSYENHIYPGDDTKTNIHDEVEEPDMDILMRTSEKLDGLSSEEKKEMIKKEQEKEASVYLIEQMEKLNKTGSFFKYVLPSMNYSDKWTHFSILPFIRYARGAGRFNYDYPNTLYAVDDFLCSDTYGIELDGKYKRGKAFTLKHDLEDVIRNDVQSHLLGYEDEDNADKFIDKAIERAELAYDCDDVETTIEFSDGEWEWFNADGGLINNGRYDESKDYPGLIMMTLDEDSKNCPDYALYTFPLWFYIADDGEIYYPGYVKMD